MKKPFFSTLFFFLSLSVLLSQNSWSRLLDVEEHCGSCEFKDMEKVDGGFLVLMVDVDTTLSSAINWQTTYVIKYSLAGDFIWRAQYDFTNTTPYGFNRGTIGEELIRLPNSEWAVRGFLALLESEPFIAKMDISGEVVAFENYSEEFQNLRDRQLYDGIYALGETFEGGIELVLFDQNTLQVNVSFPQNFEWCDAYSIRGNAIYFNAKDSVGSGTHKFDMLGNKLAFSPYNGIPIIWSSASQLMTFDKDTLYVLDESLNLIEYHLLKNYSPFGGSIFGTEIYDFESLNSGGIVFGGSTGPTNAPDELLSPFLVQLNPYGIEVFSIDYELLYLPPNSILAVEEVHDGFVVVVGEVGLNWRDWLIRLDKDGLLFTNEPLKSSTALNIYPNPVQEVLNVQFPSSGNWSIVIINALGEEVMRLETHDTHVDPINMSIFPAGIYFIIGKNIRGETRTAKFKKL